MTYKEIKDLDVAQPTTDELPFLKRHPYRDEAEYRLIYESASKRVIKFDLPLEPEGINRIYLSPWHPASLRDSTAGVVQSFTGFENVRIHRTTVLENAKWVGHADRAVDDSPDALA